MAVLLVGLGSGLNQQKYRDASNELMSYIEDQYNLVSNVNNTHDATTTCQSNQITTGGTAVEPGRSVDCTIVGRILRTTNGQTITSTQVVATRDAIDLPLNATDTDAQVLRDAKLVAFPSSDTYTPGWSTTIAKAGTNGATPATFSILIVRMPTSGVVHTYVSNSGTAQPADFFLGASPSPTTADTKLCLTPNGLLGMSTQPAGVMIAANAANGSGVSFVAQGGC